MRRIGVRFIVVDTLTSTDCAFTRFEFRAHLSHTSVFAVAGAYSSGSLM